MWLLADFAYKNPDWIKVLDKWRNKSSALLDNNYSDINVDRYDILYQLRESARIDKNIYKQKPKLEFLKKKYIDPTTNKERKVVTGIARIPSKTAKQIEVEYLAGNPRSVEDDRFRGALDSLDKKVGKRKIKIVGINDDVDNIYKKKFGYRLV